MNQLLPILIPAATLILGSVLYYFGLEIDTKTEKSTRIASKGTWGIGLIGGSVYPLAQLLFPNIHDQGPWASWALILLVFGFISLLFWLLSVIRRRNIK